MRTRNLLLTVPLALLWAYACVQVPSPTEPASASPESSTPQFDSHVTQGANVIRDDGFCLIKDGDPFIGLFPCTVQFVLAPSGNVNFWARGETAPQVATVHFDNASTGQFCTPLAPILKGVANTSGYIQFHCTN